MNNVLILNGPGLADLAPYSDFHDAALTLSGLQTECESMCRQLGLELDFRQTNNQEEMFRWIAKDSEGFAALIINPAGHSRGAMQIFESYRPAMQIANRKKPIIEVHLTNFYRQVEEVTQPLHEPVGEMGFICGLGKYSYLLALQAIARKQRSTARVQQAYRSVTQRIYIINGPNLNLLGRREPEIYGSDTLEDIERQCRDAGAAAELEIEFRQSNHEGQIVDWIQQAIDDSDAIVINAAAYTHTSVAIHDALRAYTGYVVELHISNPHLRESFRHVSYVSTAADAIVCGLGTMGYELIIPILKRLLAEKAGQDGNSLLS